MTQQIQQTEQDGVLTTESWKYHLQPRPNPLCFSTNYNQIFFDETNRELLIVEKDLITRLSLNRDKKPERFR
jgi:hypothetical protein